jgi:hypothetical protein
MFHFTIRDVLWLTVVVGLAISLHQQQTQVAKQREHISRQERELRKLDLTYGRLLESAVTRDAESRRSPVVPRRARALNE